MKKLFLFATLYLFALGTKAQELNFEATASYIQENTKEHNIVRYESLNGSSLSVSTNTLKEIIINKNGNIIFHPKDDLREKWKFNLLDLAKNNDFMRVSGTKLNFLLGDNYSGKYFEIETESNAAAIRLEKAFRHLLKVCTKTKDPFDN